MEREGDPETMELPEDRLKRRLPFLRAGAESLGSPRRKVPQWGLNPRL